MCGVENIARVKSANWHITSRCNYCCKFCFSKKLDDEITDLEVARDRLQKLKALEIEKLNLVGGEPVLHPLFIDIVKLAKRMGFIVSIVSNGYYLDRSIIEVLKPNVDWIGISVDSADEAVESALGRGTGSHVKHAMELAEIIHQVGIKLKINTTVTSLNWKEDMRPLIRTIKPDRWKVFQVLRIIGQNDQYFGALSITNEQFTYFKSLNGEIECVSPVFESNPEMIASYFMLSPSGMVMSNLDGTNRTLTRLENIDRDSFSRVLDTEQYLGRGGIYSW